MGLRDARSFLFVPANRPERFDKALASGAHAVIVDLEDAVPVAEKNSARNALGRWLSETKPVLIRINGAHTEWFERDVQLARASGCAGIMLPKAEAPDQIAAARTTIGDKPVLPIVETATGIARMDGIACCPGVLRLVLGTIDLQVDLGIAGDDDALAFFRSRLVLASRLAELAAPVEGVTTAIDDAERLRADTDRARRFGFGAKLCIHPRQIGVVNAAFAPTPEEVAWARRVLAATAASRGAAVQVDGGMVDAPVIVKAEAIVREHERRSGP